jgi:uncharacterized membrane protein YphA (DoxX/SURF4 family)
MERPMPNDNANLRQLPLALLRILVGWHFLYEGLTKLLDSSWSSAGYLAGSNGLLGGFFRWLVSNETMMAVTDQLNIWGLILIGLSLMLGVLIRPAAIGGMVLLAFYYMAYPPLFSPAAGGAEGTYLIVNKNLVELLALAVIVGFPAAVWGLDGLIARMKSDAGAEPASTGDDELAPKHMQHSSRRALVTSLAGVPFLGGLAVASVKKHGWKSFEEVELSRAKIDGTSSATLKRFKFATIADLEEQVPMAKIGDVEFSRMIMGGNLIGGWAHARDLIYASKLVKAYHHRDKIFETLHTAEQCGVNALITNPLLCGMVNDYWKYGGKIKFISDCGGNDVIKMIQKSIDNGASACYIQGAVADALVEKGDFDTMAAGLDLIRRNGIPAGIGGHTIKTIQGSVNAGLKPDFWMKTLHSLDYWSAKPEEERDNRWCYDPAETIAFMNQLEEPWIAFKILGAGAIKPEVGFKYAFENGADFICVGMYDFQVVEDVNLCCNILAGDIPRERPWRA